MKKDMFKGWGSKWRGSGKMAGPYDVEKIDKARFKSKQREGKKIDLLFREIFNRLRFDDPFLSFPNEDMEDLEVVKENLKIMSEHLDKIRYSEEVRRELSLGIVRSIQDEALYIHRESPELSLAECYRIAVLKLFETFS